MIVTATSVSIWLSSTMYRRYRLYRTPLIGKITLKCQVAGATKIVVALDRQVVVPPGSYFNIFFPARLGYNHIGCPAVALWHVPDDVNSSLHLSFLLACTSNAAALARLKNGHRVRLEGPFGQKHHLESHETVMLAAKGIGIAGVLPFALELAKRRRHDDRIKLKLLELSKKQNTLFEKERESRGDERDRISKKRQKIVTEKEALARKPLFRVAAKTIDLYWSLESNSQVEWITRELRTLQKMDPQNVSSITLHPAP